VYVGPGDGGGYSNFLFQNNIVRDFFGEGLEINPRVTVFQSDDCRERHPQCRQRDMRDRMELPAWRHGIRSERWRQQQHCDREYLIWDIGSGCIWDRGGGTPRPAIYNNTCFDYAKGNNDPNPFGISGWVNGGTAIIRNNIIYSPNGATLRCVCVRCGNNMCGATFWSTFIPFGTACGPSSQPWSANSVLSTDPNSNAFMQIGPASEARNRGFDVSSANFISSYSGAARPQEAAYDIGAFGVWIGAIQAQGADRSESCSLDFPIRVCRRGATLRECRSAARVTLARRIHFFLDNFLCTT